MICRHFLVKNYDILRQIGEKYWSCLGHFSVFRTTFLGVISSRQKCRRKCHVVSALSMTCHRKCRVILALSMTCHWKCHVVSALLMTCRRKCHVISALSTTCRRNLMSSCLILLKPISCIPDVRACVRARFC